MNHNTNHNQEITEWHNTRNAKHHFSDPGEFIGPREWLPQTATADEWDQFNTNFELDGIWSNRAKMDKYADHQFKFAWSHVVADGRKKTCENWNPCKDELGNKLKAFHVWLVNQRLQAKTRKLLGMA